MSASRYEQDHARRSGVRIIHNAAPVGCGQRCGRGVEFAYTMDGPEGLKLATETFPLKADQVFKAIGQTLAAPEGWRSTAARSPSRARGARRGGCLGGGRLRGGGET